MSESNIGSILYAQDAGEKLSANGKAGERNPFSDFEIEICPYLGMQDDPATRQAFPSQQNRCFRGEKGQRIQVLHQQQYCLHTGHRACPIFRGDEGELGRRYGYVVGEKRSKRLSPRRLPGMLPLSINWRWLMIGVLSLALVTAGVFFSRPLWQESDAGLAAGGSEGRRLWLPAIWAGRDAPPVDPTAAAAVPMTATTLTAPLTPTAVPVTATPSPTAPATETAVPATATAIPSPPPTAASPAAAATEVACGPPVHWVRYLVRRGDTIYSLARERGATVTAVLQANCLSGARLEAGWTLYLPPLPAGFVTATPQEDTEAPEATYFISAPAPGSRVSGQVLIRGTVDFAPGQVRFYKVEIGGGATPGRWTTLGSTHTTPVQNGILEELWVGAFPPGLHTLRLVLVGPDGNYVGAPYEVGVFLVDSGE